MSATVSGKKSTKPRRRALEQNDVDRFKFFIEQIKDGVWCFQPPQPIDIGLPMETKIELSMQAVLVDCNSAYAALRGMHKEDIIGRRLEEILPDPASTIEIIRRFYEQNGWLDELETSETCPDGKQRTIMVSIFSEMVGKRMVRAWGRQKDISSEVRERAERAKADRLQKALYRIAAAASTAKDLQTTIRMVHEVVSELFPAKNLYLALFDEQKKTLQFPYFCDEKETDIPPASTAFPEKEFERSLTMFVLRSGEPLFITPEGFERLYRTGEVEEVGMPCVDWLGVPLKTADGKTFGMMAVQTYTEGERYSEVEKEILVFVSSQIGRTIEHQHMHEALREGEARQRAILNALPDLMFLIDKNGIYREYYTPRKDSREQVEVQNTFVGKKMCEVLPPDVAEAGLEIIHNVLASGKMQQFEYSLVINGIRQYFDARIAPYSKDVTLTIARDITQRIETESQLRAVNEEMNRTVEELKLRNREVSLMNKMGDMLQSCLTTKEAYAVIQQYSQRLFLDTSGALYIHHPSKKNIFEKVANWGAYQPAEEFIESANCWGLRRGRLHIVTEPKKGLNCEHHKRIFHDGQMIPYLCSPMIAHGETIGMLYISALAGYGIDRWEALAVSFSEQIALSLSNLNLRQMLQNQSIRDSLTNLFNRRYMQETLERELSRARRYGQPLSVAMADIDHFKNYNDKLGHEAGDIVLQEIGALITSIIRKEDIPCRYGGDELAIILPGASIEDGSLRIEQVRQGVQRLPLKQVDEENQISVSFGIACYPQHGLTAKELMNMADKALYEAKRRGRNCVVAAPLIDG